MVNDFGWILVHKESRDAKVEKDEQIGSALDTEMEFFVVRTQKRWNDFVS